MCLLGDELSGPVPALSPTLIYDPEDNDSLLSHGHGCCQSTLLLCLHSLPCPGWQSCSGRG